LPDSKSCLPSDASAFRSVGHRTMHDAHVGEPVPLLEIVDGQPTGASTSSVHMVRPPFAPVLAALLGTAAFWGVLELTEPPGPGLDPDALSYLGAGVSLAHGDGLRVPSAGWASADTAAPLVHFPPGFSVGIAAGVAVGLAPINAARIVEAVAACVTIVAIVLTAAAAGGLATALAAAAIVAATPALVAVHAGVLSEPLFLALLACFVGVLARERGANGTRRALVLGALAAAATLVRYAGASLVAAAVFDAFVSSAPPDADESEPDAGVYWRERIGRAVVAAALPAIALGAWMLTRPLSADAERIREVGLYTNGLGATLAGGAATDGRWFAPGIEAGAAMTIIALAVLAGIIALFVRAAREVRRGEGRANDVLLYRAVELVALCYVLVVGASRLIADPGIPLDERILAPLFLLASLAIGVALASCWRSAFGARGTANRGRALFAFGITVSWIVGAAGVSGTAIREAREDGGDLAASEWRLSPLVDWAAHAEPGTHLYSNWPATVWLHTGRAAAELPYELDADIAAEFRAKIEGEHGAVLAFAVKSPDAVPPDSLAKLAGLVAAARWPEGTVWRAPQDSAGRAGAASAVRSTIRP
jgi:hypothetical protein